MALLAMALPVEAGVDGDPAECVGFVTEGDYIFVEDPTVAPGAGCGDDDNGCDGFQNTEEEAAAAGCDETDTTTFSVTVP
ncbi:MAG: hypothetical protein ACPGQL_06265 [Thermoplasmatota archaeon]